MAGEDLDDLEYHVTFPTPKPGRDQVEDWLEKTLQERETAVMIIGWMNCQDKYLAKYSKVYEDLGCVTVRYSPTSTDLTSENAAIVAKKLLEVLIEMNLSDNPVLFHIFSNGGCIIYNAMRNELKNATPQNFFDDIVKLGVVYDSAPGRPRLSQWVTAAFHGYQPNIFTYLLKAGYYVMGSFYFGLSKLFNILGVNFSSGVFDDMVYYQDSCPEMYLFSKTDEIISATDIEDMIDRRRMQSIDITAKCWEDSPHVQHLRVHQDSYIKHCCDFLSKCVKLAKECEYYRSDSDTADSNIADNESEEEYNLTPVAEIKNRKKIQ